LNSIFLHRCIMGMFNKIYLFVLHFNFTCFTTLVLHLVHMGFQVIRLYTSAPYNWNIVESGVKHHIPKPLLIHFM
jgi:hypothetical protein